MQYSKYFANKMRISQGYNEGNHKRHTTSIQKDYPVDETYGAAGSGGYFIAPFDCKIVRKYDAVSNYIWITSTDKVRTPSGDKIVSILIAHISASEFNVLKVGDAFKQGQKVVSEAVDANSTGHHNHVCAGFGELSGTGWAKQVVGGNEFWVLTTKEGTQKPEDVFYVDKSVTEIVDNAGINFKEMPTEEISEEPTEDFFGGLGYFKDGDEHPNINRIAEFMLKTFPKYTSEKALGPFYGPYIKSSIKEFQRRAKLEGNYDSTVDGYFGPITLESLKKYGFQE
ncbi:MAG TPA: peptidoglycan-binding protein [Candidatus Onthocola stercorigallinarum]|nr:peptidoglycan-binding protein [Candidatus Onthocola stercorigallinarum]